MALIVVAVATKLVESQNLGQRRSIRLIDVVLLKSENGITSFVERVYECSEHLLVSIGKTRRIHAALDNDFSMGDSILKVSASLFLGPESLHVFCDTNE
jgi:hypothetical protein